MLARVRFASGVVRVTPVRMLPMVLRLGHSRCSRIDSAVMIGDGSRAATCGWRAADDTVYMSVTEQTHARLTSDSVRNRLTAFSGRYSNTYISKSELRQYAIAR